MKKQPPFRTMIMPERFYKTLDRGIRFAVRVLHAYGFETCQSCEGGKGHAYDWPSVDLIATGDDAQGLEAVSALYEFGLPLRDVSLVWNLRHGLPYEKLWRVTFWKPMPERANETPNFIWGYQAQ